MKTKNILFVVVGIFLLCIFFFKIIPIPVENMMGANNPDVFIYGGIYWTSLFQELNFGNYWGYLLCFFLFIVSIPQGKLWFR